VSKVPPGVSQHDLYVAARRVLLDAAAALTEQHQALILVGAQAVYLRCGEADIPVALYTADADIGLDRSLLSDEPRLQDAMHDAGFELRSHGSRLHPGTWIRTVQVGDLQLSIPVDILIPSQFSQTAERRRTPSIPPHDRMAVRKVEGLELAMIDNNIMLIESLDPADHRSVQMKVAGPVALLVAKAHKIRDRVAEATPGREADKDAGDVIRLMRTSNARKASATFSALLADPDVRIAETARAGIILLMEQFGRARSVGVVMAQNTLAGAMPAEAIEALATAFIRNLLAATKEPVIWSVTKSREQPLR
jgi:hypothetical protein